MLQGIHAEKARDILQDRKLFNYDLYSEYQNVENIKA